MSDAADQIRNLLHRYAEAVDTGHFEVVEELFAHARFRGAFNDGEPDEGTTGAETAAGMRKTMILYADGTPRTRHTITNEIVEVDEAAGTARSRCYLVTLQQVPGRPIEMIATARYHDSFERIGETWRFSDRIVRRSSIDGQNRDFIGDMSRHTSRTFGPPPPKAGSPRA